MLNVSSKSCYPPCGRSPKPFLSEAGRADPVSHWVTADTSDKVVDGIPFLLVNVYRHMAARACHLSVPGTPKSKALLDAVGNWKTGWVLGTLEKLRNTIIPCAGYRQARFADSVYTSVKAAYAEIFLDHLLPGEEGNEEGQ